MIEMGYSQLRLKWVLLLQNLVVILTTEKIKHRVPHIGMNLCDEPFVGHGSLKAVEKRESKIGGIM
jgi:hypothetical protein